MATYLIDFENVRSDGLRGVNWLTETDTVVIFYSNNADTLTFEAMDLILNSNATIRKFKIARGGKNALDFQLATYLGFLIHENVNPYFYIISRDNGFHYVIDFWKRTYRYEGYVFCCPSIAEAYSKQKRFDSYSMAEKEAIIEELNQEELDTEVLEEETASPESPFQESPSMNPTSMEPISMESNSMEPTSIEPTSMETSSTDSISREEDAIEPNAMASSAIDDSLEASSLETFSLGVSSLESSVSDSPSADSPETTSKEAALEKSAFVESPFQKSNSNEAFSMKEDSNSKDFNSEDSNSLDSNSLDSHSEDPLSEDPLSLDSDSEKPAAAATINHGTDSRKEASSMPESVLEFPVLEEVSAAEDFPARRPSRRQKSPSRRKPKTEKSTAQAAALEPDTAKKAETDAEAAQPEAPAPRRQTRTKKTADKTEKGEHGKPAVKSKKPSLAELPEDLLLPLSCAAVQKAIALTGDLCSEKDAQIAASHLIHSSGKQDFYRKMTAYFGQKHGIAVYNSLRSEYTNIRKNEA